MIKQLLIWLIVLYQNSLSYLIGGQCRFYPTCSEYSKQALHKHGALKGSFLAVKRVCSCHPLHEGGIDQVPDTFRERND